MSPLSSDEAYRQAGVDLKRAEQVVDIARQAAQKTPFKNMLSGIGGFSGAFELPAGYRQPVLLSACDGVGTKLKLAFTSGIHNTVGIDLVAMSVNDLLVNGGQPLVFLDYFACDRIQPEILEPVLEGIAEGCAQSGCSLAGGETAELPGFYAPGEYDLAGFAVGVVEKSKMLPQKDLLADGDVLIGLASSGLHSNGYSLVRKVLFQDNNLTWDQHIPALNSPLAECLLTPTRIYVSPILALLEALPDAVKAMVHITGGGFYDNIPRVLPEGFSAIIDGDSWERPAIYPFLQSMGQLTPETMYHTFNCGIGFMLAVKAEAANAVVQFLNGLSLGYPIQPVGVLRQTPGQREVIIK